MSIKVEYNSLEWGLYQSEPTSDAAASALNEAATEAVRALKKAIESFNAVAQKHTDAGATDTEPRYEFAQLLIDTVRGYV